MVRVAELGGELRPGRSPARARNRSAASWSRRRRIIASGGEAHVASREPLHRAHRDAERSRGVLQAAAPPGRSPSRSASALARRASSSGSGRVLADPVGEGGATARSCRDPPVAPFITVPSVATPPVAAPAIAATTESRSSGRSRTRAAVRERPRVVDQRRHRRRAQQRPRRPASAGQIAVRGPRGRPGDGHLRALHDEVARGRRRWVLTRRPPGGEVPLGDPRPGDAVGDRRGGGVPREPRQARGVQDATPVLAPGLDGATPRWVHPRQ